MKVHDFKLFKTVKSEAMNSVLWDLRIKHNYQSFYFFSMYFHTIYWYLWERRKLSFHKIVFKDNFFSFCMILFIFRERGREGERKGEEHQCVVDSRMSQPGTWPVTPACALTGYRTSDPFVCRPALNPLSHTSQSLKIASLVS